MDRRNFLKCFVGIAGLAVFPSTLLSKQRDRFIYDPNVEFEQPLFFVIRNTNTDEVVYLKLLTDDEVKAHNDKKDLKIRIPNGIFFNDNGDNWEKGKCFLECMKCSVE